MNVSITIAGDLSDRRMRGLLGFLSDSGLSFKQEVTSENNLPGIVLPNTNVKYTFDSPLGVDTDANVGGIDRIECRPVKHRELSEEKRQEIIESFTPLKVMVYNTMCGLEVGQSGKLLKVIRHPTSFVNEHRHAVHNIGKSALFRGKKFKNKTIDGDLTVIRIR